ncbi:MAG TPA: SH3 domain-containing protein [Mogibacterium sp.]|nr:SH3 domain-containing protein [Mogibacterium sp.]
MKKRNRLIKNLTHIFVFLLLAGFIFLVQPIDTYAASVPSGTGVVKVKEGAYLRKRASTSSSRLRLLKKDTKLTIYREVFKSKTSTRARYKWYYVNANGRKGYIRSDCVGSVRYSAVSAKINGKVNYRVGPGLRMKKTGVFRKGTAVTVYMKATPVSSTRGSTSTWYKIKKGSRYYYVSSSYVDIVGSIFVNNTTTSNTTNDNASTNTDKPSTSTSMSQMTNAEFETYMTKQGFPSSYKTKLRALHKAHPEWIFVAKHTGISWSTAVSKQSANGVSLIHASEPLSRRATDSKSFTSGTRNVYKYASTSKKIGQVKNKAKFTVLTEVWKGKTRWCKIKTADGLTGYIQGALYRYSYPSTISGVTNDSDVNIRKGAGTDNAAIKSLSKGTRISIVLQATDKSGNVWYKIRNGSGYAYIIAKYVDVDQTVETKETVTTVKLSEAYPKGASSASLQYRAAPNKNFPGIGNISAGTEFTIIASVNDLFGEVWYQIYLDGDIVYIESENVITVGEIKPTEYPTSITGKTTDALNYRTGPGTSYSVAGTFNSGTKVKITDSVVKNSETWYAIDIDGKEYYSSALYINIDLVAAPLNSVPEITKETKTTKITAKPNTLTGTGSVLEGRWIPKDGSTWFNANSKTVAYYLDPRNFLNEDRIYMFENLSYQKDYQTRAVVSKVLTGTQLPKYGFSSRIFVDAGSIYDISPVFLAARARQETGGGSVAISGKYGVYNPFNIGATSSSNPVMNGINYARKRGWTTQKKAVNGGASFLASGYINAGQNSIYFQKFNVANGLSKLATHQYMTNIQAPYHESYTTKISYKAFGITEEPLTFIIPVYKGMPSSTKLP